MSGKPWTAEEEAHLMEKVNAIDADFKGFIRSARGLSDLQMQGQWWHAAHAPAGVVDSTRFPTLQSLIDSGTVWSLEGSAGRAAMQALESGACFLPLQRSRDYWGNTIPARSDLKPGTKGTLENSARFYNLN
jgi:hypothetical protein